MFSYIDVRCYHLTGDLNAWQSFVGNKAKSTCLCVSYNMICGKLQWWKLLWAILVICFLKSCVHYRLIVFKATVEWKLWLFIKYCLPCDEHICRIPHPFLPLYEFSILVHPFNWKFDTGLLEKPSSFW